MVENAILVQVIVRVVFPSGQGYVLQSENLAPEGGVPGHELRPLVVDAAREMIGKVYEVASDANYASLLSRVGPRVLFPKGDQP